ncbi:ATP-binding protein [Desulfopila aestuarii]|uniref:histidine kinase n=1 Tax=Desulfopila aestuarii DSM 18488 TaxID=1121416 RepID=A0A1M7YJL5_9BACT|nr:ATP-binding protein [Desulfopila aestuarii]SHO52804.1 Signal transduction histidine kinase [Desulfopila aestuarii DSM 18488]
MNSFKAILITCMVLGISFLHMTTIPARYGLHILHSELFFIPIILASFWFGMRIGLGAAILVCIIYSPMVVHDETPTHGAAYAVLFTQLVMYLFVSILIGWLSDRRQSQQRKLIEGERMTTLAKAAAALSFEIKDAVTSLASIHQRSAGLINPEEDQNFQQELGKLRRLMEVLERFMPEKQVDAISADLNQLLESSYHKYLQPAQKAQVQLVLQADAAGCPSMIVSEALGRVLDNIIENAIEASEPGKKIFLRSKRGGSSCYLEVTDEGEGISQQNRPKLFTPFFTTKPHGDGLALAAGRKVLRDHDGDIVYLPGTTSGSTFRIIVPRENADRNLDQFLRETRVDRDDL